MMPSASSLVERLRSALAEQGYVHVDNGGGNNYTQLVGFRRSGRGEAVIHVEQDVPDHRSSTRRVAPTSGGHRG